MDTNEIAQLLWQSESETLDFKRDQYPFDGATDDQRSELLKDILAFANGWRSTTARILIGVEEVKHGRSLPVGAPHLMNRTLQSFVNTKTNRPVKFSYEACEIEGKSIGILEVPTQDRPIFLTKKFGRLEANTVYIRRGDTTAIADPDEIAHMGARREQASNHPLLTFAFGDREKRSKFEGTIEAETTCYSFPKSKALPRYGVNHMIGISLNHENENYFVDAAHYLRDVPHLQGMLEAIEDKIAQPTPERIRSLQVEVALLTRLANDLGQLAQAQTVAHTFHMKALDVCSTLQHTVQSMSSILLERVDYG